MSTDRLELFPAGRPERVLGNPLTWRAAALARTLSSVWRRGVVRPLHDVVDAWLLSADLGPLNDRTLEDVGLRRETQPSHRAG